MAAIPTFATILERYTLEYPMWEQDDVFIGEELRELKAKETPKNLTANSPGTRAHSTSMN